MSFTKIKSFLPALYQSPLVLLLVLLPQLVLLLINFSGYDLIKSELSKVSENNFFGFLINQEQGWVLLFVLQILLIGLMALVALGHYFQKKREINYWINLPILLLNSTYLWIMPWFVGSMFPSSVTSWILTQDYFLYCQFALVMPAVFYSLSVLASFKIKSEVKLLDAFISLGLSVSLPLVVYGSSLIFLWFAHLFYAKQQYGTVSSFQKFLLIPSILLLVLVTIITLMAVFRFVIIIHQWIHKKGKIPQTILVLIFALALPIGGLILNIYIPFPVNFQSLEVYILTVVNAIFLLIPKFGKPALDKSVWIAQVICLPFSLYFFLG
ncbi:MAG: hypothetical protein SFU25_07675 [Candidatus Caenarcaniphilales bacterium]|nr:hypothetical protein [Candidatus Caenarcaniphilales bacterium]